MFGVVPSGVTFIRSFVESGKTWLKSGNGAAETDTRTFRYSHLNTHTLIPTFSFRIFTYRATQTHLGSRVHTHTQSQDGDLRSLLLSRKKGSLLNCCSLFRKAPCWEQPSFWRTERNYIIQHSSLILVAIVQRRSDEARRRHQMIHPAVM